MRPGKNGEVIIEDRLEGWYVKMGARLLRNKDLVEHVKETPSTPEVGKTLSPEYTDDVKASLEKISGMSPLISPLLMVYPWGASMLLEELETGKSRYSSSPE